MKKFIYIGISILIIFVLIIVIIMTKQNNDKDAISQNIVQNEEANTIENVEQEKKNEIENIVENNETNTNTENIVQNEETNSIISEALQEDPKTAEEKVINIVKKDWGKDSSVEFAVEGMEADGFYIVTVRNSETTEALAFYRVNATSGKFEKMN